MQTGTVKHFNDEKGYGFIVVDNSEDEVFFHISELTESWEGMKPRKGDKVSFKVVSGDRGPKAIEVTKAGAEDSADEGEAPEESMEEEMA